MSSVKKSSGAQDGAALQAQPDGTVPQAQSSGTVPQAQSSGTAPQPESEAMDIMNRLNEHLTALGWQDGQRELLLVRLLLCFFSEQTDVFRPASFFGYLEDERTKKLPPSERLAVFFAALGGKQPDPVLPDLSGLPVISRALFADSGEMPALDESFLDDVLACRDFPWRNLSPAIFGAMFQEIMDQDARREWGTFYTSEENIDRVIDPLLFDDLLAEREECRGNRRKLEAFQERLGKLTFLENIRPKMIQFNASRMCA